MQTCVCLPSYQREESFSYRDVQFAYTQRGFNYTWMWLGLICIALGECKRC